MVDERCSKVPWLIKVVWNPVVAFDLTDRRNRTDHSKVVPWAFLVVACVFKGVGKPFAWYELLALGSLSFGYGAWRTFLKTKSMSGTFSQQNVDTRVRSEHITTIRTERDPVAGVDPA